MLWWLLAACALKSGLTIQGNDQFVLGDNEHGAFRATVKNTGPVPVEVLARSEGQDRPVGEVAPGDEVALRFGVDEAAVFSNISGDVATLKVRVVGDQGLSMAFESGVEGDQ